MNSNSGDDKVGPVGGALEDERGQGDAKVKPSLKKDEPNVPNPSDGAGATGPLKEDVLLNLKVGASSLENAREESLAKKQRNESLMRMEANSDKEGSVVKKADKEQMTRRAAWREQVKAESAKRAEYERQREGTPRDQISDWKDKQSLSKISKKWRNKFRVQRTGFLFNELFPILSSQDNLTSNEILTCRLVSKGWKDPIDNWLSTSSPLYARLKTDKANVPLPRSSERAGATGLLKDLSKKMGASSLENARAKKLAERRAAWKEEVNKELEKRAEFKRKMEAVPMEQVASWDYLKQSMSKMSTEWRDSFKEERTTFLFKEVFTILIKTPKSYYFNDVLSYRKVSKGWKETIDHFASTTLETYVYTRTKSGYFEKVSFRFQLWCPRFSQLGELIRFNTERSRAFRRNPFITRKLMIGSELIPSNREMWIEMLGLLRRWGGELWFVEIYLPIGMGMEVMYEMLVEWLSLTPNLRALKIVDQDGEKTREVEMLRNLGFDGYRPLKELMARKSLPELPNLINIQLNQFLPDPIISALLEKCGNSLETVNLAPKRGPSDQGEYQVGGGLPNIKQLSLSGWMSASTFHFPLLEDMALEGYKDEEGKGAKDVISAFKTLNSCGSTLKRLRLLMGFGLREMLSPNCPDYFLTRPVSLKLPLLERLLIEVSCTDLRNLDFLLELGSLKELDLRYDKLAPIRPWPNNKTFSIRSSRLEDVTIQFAGFEDRLGESNIWKLLPELRLISLKVAVFIKEVVNDARGRPVKMGVREVFDKRVTHTWDGHKCEKVIVIMDEQFNRLV